MHKLPPSISDLPPIDRATLIAAMKYLEDPLWKPSLKELSNRYQITKSKTEMLLNFGINLGFIEIEMENNNYRGSYNAKEYKRFSLTEEGKNFLDQNQS